MFKLVVWRFRSRIVEDDFDTMEEAISSGECGADEGYHFFECVLDDNNIIVYTPGHSIIGGSSYQHEVGKEYVFD